VQRFELDDLLAAQRQGGARYHEFLVVPSLSAGIYVLPAGADDLQQPHREDEVYHVLAGRGRIRVGDEEEPVGPGSTVYVAKEVVHRFVEIAEELVLLVLFAPAQTRQR
jgi:mannose-6-phosphate isomerase-like protein (cupin superfamily)